jgi:thiamine biosynthesis lipoprotein
MDRISIDEGWRQRAVMPPVITYEKREPAVQFDPNGIAQGYTVDVLAMLLQQRGIMDYMVEVGGEVRCAGVNDKGATWVMQIDKPVEGDAHVQQTTVPLQDRSLATSGNYRKFIEIGGRRYGHTIDPRTGRPAMNALLSASVVADDCATADALGTALMVLGPADARAWLSRHREVEAYLVMDDGRGGTEVWTTPGWPLIDERD